MFKNLKDTLKVLIFGGLIAKDYNSKKEKADEVYNIIQDGLNEMEAKGVDRILLALDETEPAKNTTGWIDMNRSKYYDYKILDEDEQKIIDEKKTYQVMALVVESPFNIVKYGEKGMENYTRTRIIPLLPVSKPESNLFYVVSGGFLSGDNLKEYVDKVVNDNSDWTPEGVRKAIQFNIAEYQDKTKQLLKNHSGLQTKLAQMEERKYSPQEQVFNEIKKQIYK